MICKVDRVDRVDRVDQVALTTGSHYHHNQGQCTWLSTIQEDGMQAPQRKKRVRSLINNNTDVCVCWRQSDRDRVQTSITTRERLFDLVNNFARAPHGWPTIYNGKWPYF